MISRAIVFLGLLFLGAACAMQTHREIIQQERRQTARFKKEYANRKVEPCQSVQSLGEKSGEVMNPIIDGLSMPRDLSPSITPVYSKEASIRGIEGVVTVMVVVDQCGQVLLVEPFGERLGYGLEERVQEAFILKRYEPSRDKAGRTYKARFLKRVRFQLADRNPEKRKTNERQ